MSFIPAEIRLPILGYCPDVPTAANLGRTCRQFHATWSQSKKSICEGILIRTLECYEDVRALATDQRQLDPTLTSWEYYISCILSNAKTAERACSAIAQRSTFFLCGRHRLPLNQTERRRFLSAYYRIWQLSELLKRNYGISSLFFGMMLHQFFSNRMKHPTDVYLVSEVAYTLVFDMYLNETGQMSLYPAMAESDFWQDVTPDPRMYPWESAAWILKRTAQSRATEQGMRRVPGYGTRLDVLLDCNQHLLTRPS
ncbi:MAG: hypothetical protein L6R40_008216 [Gallowayella cf. fulva]|nr:MAG: hypothetical protein L6R40_008216 [Xanthomendoza cf. fulva]